VTTAFESLNPPFERNANTELGVNDSFSEDSIKNFKAANPSTRSLKFLESIFEEVSSGMAFRPPVCDTALYHKRKKNIGFCNICRNDQKSDNPEASHATARPKILKITLKSRLMISCSGRFGDYCKHEIQIGLARNPVKL
jgi:hypothetical protein